MGMIFGSLIFVLAAVLAVLAVTDAQKSRLLQQEMKPEKMPGMPMIQQRYPPQNRGVTEEK